MKKKSLKIAGHATSLALETEFWEALKDIAIKKGVSIASLIVSIDSNSNNFSHKNLASEIRVFILNHYKNG